MKGRTVEKYYRRVNDIDEKIKNISLSYFQWKVLFLVLEDTNISDLVKTLDSDEKEVQGALDSLIQNGILEEGNGEKVAIEEEPVEILEDTSEEVELLEEVLEMPEEVHDEEVESEIVSESEEEVEEIMDESLEGHAAEVLEDQVEEIEEEEVEQSESPFKEETFPEETESETEKVGDDTIEEEINVEQKEEPEPEIEESKMDTLEETLEQTEIEEDAQEEDETTDISSFIDEIGSDEEKEQEETVVQEEIKQEPEVEEKPKAGPSADAKTVMVVDDSIVIRKMVEIALEDGDYKIVTSNSGKDGLNLLDEESPDLVIVDMTLPDMNGIDLLKTVKASKGIPVIMLSGKDAPQLVENAKSAGADDFLPKPFRDDDLVEKVKNLLK